MGSDARGAGRRRRGAPRGARPARRRETGAALTDEAARRIEEIGSGVGIVGVAATRLSDGRHIGVREDELFPTASVFKVPLLVALYAEALAGRLDLGERVGYRADTRVAGSGVLQFLDDGLNPTLRDLAVLMMTVSDNTATDLVLERVTKDRVNATMREYGLRSIAVPFGTREMLMELVDMDPAQPGGYDELRRRLRASAGSGGRSIVPAETDRTTPREMCRLLELLATDAILDAGSCRAILEIMERIQSGTRLPGLLPKGTVVAHKTGSLRRIRNDVGIVRAPNGAYAAAIFTRELVRDNVDDERAVAAMSLAVYEALAG